MPFATEDDASSVRPLNTLLDLFALLRNLSPSIVSSLLESKEPKLEADPNALYHFVVSSIE